MPPLCSMSISNFCFFCIGSKPSVEGGSIWPQLRDFLCGGSLSISSCGFLYTDLSRVKLILPLCLAALVGVLSEGGVLHDVTASDAVSRVPFLFGLGHSTKKRSTNSFKLSLIQSV